MSRDSKADAPELTLLLACYIDEAACAIEIWPLLWAGGGSLHSRPPWNALTDILLFQILK